MKPVVCCLAVGTPYLRMALGCLASCRQVAGDKYRYVVFSAWCDKDAYEVPEFVEVVDVEPLLNYESKALYEDSYRKLSAEEVERDKFAARELKWIPFAHPEFIDTDLLYIDADAIVFDDVFDELFELTKKNSVATMGGVLSKDAPLWPNFPHFDLVERCAAAGLTVRNRATHTGIVGRAADERGRFCSETFERLLKNKPMRPLPNYFNDEAYFSVALELTRNELGEDNFNSLNEYGRMRTTLGNEYCGETEAGKPKTRPLNSEDEPDANYSILHFHTITTWKSDFYQRWLEEYVPLKSTK